MGDEGTVLERAGAGRWVKEADKGGARRRGEGGDGGEPGPAPRRPYGPSRARGTGHEK